MDAILLVDPNENEASFTATMLDEYGFAVEIVEGQVSAKRLIDDYKYDLILLDLVPSPRKTPLKDMERVEIERTSRLIQELRSRGISCPIIVCTVPSHWNDDAECACLDGGADDFVDKLKVGDGMVVRLNMHLRRWRQTHGVNRAMVQTE